MKLDIGTGLVLAAVFSLIGFWFAGMVGFWCMFIIIIDILKQAAECADREVQR